MDRKEYRELWWKEYKQVKKEFQDKYWIDEECIYSRKTIEEECKISIDNCVAMCNIQEESTKWLESLKKGDSIKYKQYRYFEGRILTIDKGCQGKILSVQVQHDGYENKVDVLDIVYKGSEIVDIREKYRHITAYLFFGKSDIGKIEQILQFYNLFEMTEERKQLIKNTAQYWVDNGGDLIEQSEIDMLKQEISDRFYQKYKLPDNFGRG